MRIKQKLDPKINDIFDANHVKFAALFGSRAKGGFSVNSDYDFLVKFKPNYRYTIFNLLELKEQLKKGLKKPVDVVPYSGLNPRIKSEVFKTMKVVYGSR